ncbi:UDP-2,3-diacylglucosamine diphosphatase [Pseudohalioglobus lutimaris]|uniref:UDP-2,3-diacylglucosamine hydrolase n=1 Tax=Pseudohalioglobus lutimaris TaxID=1737061 RepID=A0A2N5X4M7_9GAMM|nr:UDP-2,3-diacylglucosamine diphosphatase [Pseudohalioglobus lutimaris]PLW69439.1 UDP-2,3-diacylglucosamine diphosphatase [Pseudohalioglobus lutimaris]
MSRTLFISDLHLDTARPDITGALAAFLQNNNDCDTLYVLGDLFEVWVGDDDDSSFAAQIADLFRSFTAAGPALKLMQGNRDFLLGEAFCTSVGATLLADPSVIDLYGTPTLLMHGDSLCTGDSEYMAFRATARDAQWQADLLAKPLAERRAFAAHLRSASKEASSNKAEDIMDVTPSEVDRVMVEAGVSRLIHGHTHRPARHRSAQGERIVLGDWDSRGWCIEATSSSFELLDFPI